MTRTWLAFVFSGTVAAAVMTAQNGPAPAQTPVPEPVVATDATPQDPVPADSASAQEEAAEPEEASPCVGIAADAARLSGVLSAVPRYGSTYVLVVPSRLADRVANATSPEVRNLSVGVTSGSAAADVARTLGITKIDERAHSASAPVQLLEDVRDGKLDAAVMWAPLAGIGILELGLDGQVSLYSVDRPHPGPAALHATASDDPCAPAIADELDVSGVLPAELLVSVEIRDLLGERPPEFDLAQAKAAESLFNETCAQCHGESAIADPKGLAPVDLRLSVRRFSYAGFHYIVLNGRPARSMPGFRGTITSEQIAQLYQYLKARSNNVLAAAPPSAPPAQ